MLQRPPFRADHIRSLLRPPPLRQAFRRHESGELNADSFRLLQDESIRAAVRMQEEVGLKVVTDGEFRRSSYWARFVERVEGFAIRTAAYRFRDEHGHELSFAAPVAAGKMRPLPPL